MDDFQIVLNATESSVERQLREQMLDGPDRDRGGIRNPDTLVTDPRGSMFACNRWLALLLCPESRFHADAMLAGRIDALLDYMLRRQHPDGTIDLGNWRHAPCEVGFTLPAACHNLRKLQAAGGIPRKDAILGKLGRFIENGGRAVREGQMYTANHRWTPGVAALACVDEIFPHPGNLEKIEDYLDDGIDCTHDGIWYAERSPNYNMVADCGLLIAAEKLNRPELLEHVRRNLDYCLHVINPSGYAESGLSFRQDRGVPNAIFGSYSVYKIMAVQDANPVWAQAADVLLQESVARGRLDDFIPVLQIFDRPGVRDEHLPRGPLPVRYHRHWPNAGVVRVRDDRFAVTIKGNAKPDDDTGWGGPVGEANFLAIHSGGAAIECVMVKFGYQPDQAFKPRHVEKTPNGYRLFYYWKGFHLHMTHRRHGRRDMWMAADLALTAGVKIEGHSVRLNVKADGLPHVPIAVELLIDPDGELLLDGKKAPLAAGQRVWFDAAEARYSRGGDSIVIRPGLCEHRLPIQDLHVVTGNAEQRCARLVLCGYSPFAHEVVVEG